jgi:ABC-type bacteriocin/lantibiotic exporter with double-glycine peptidase domain
MNQNLRLILSSFTRQENANDCGAACLKMIFNFTGIDPELPASASDEPLSLFQLQQLATDAGLAAKAVRMDLEHLRGVPYPCILHVMTEAKLPHFIVFFGYDAELNLYLVSDPDVQVGYLTEAELMLRWQSTAAVYLEDSQPKSRWRTKMYPWTYLLHFDFVPGILWFAVPLLNVCGSLLGLGATLVVEKAISPEFLNGKLGFLTLVFVLLSMLSIARCALSYVKERLVINFASGLDATLYLDFIRQLDRSPFSSGFLAKRFSEAIKDVQRIHQSVSMLVGGVLSDALMVMILLVCIYYYFPLLVLVEAIVIITLLLLTNRQLPFLLVTSGSVTLPSFTPLQTDKPDGASEPEQLVAASIEANAAISRKSFRVSSRANKLNLYFEAIASFNIVIVLGYCISALRSSGASYPEFIFGVILCFATINLVTKICNQLFLVAQGAGMLGCRSKEKSHFR